MMREVDMVKMNGGLFCQNGVWVAR